MVVTGAAGGLGAAVVDALVDAGAICHLPQRGPVATTATGPRRPVAGVDLASEAAVTAFYAALPPLWGSVHLAGGYAASPLTETTLVQWREQLDRNLTTAFLCCREAVRAMRRTPGAGGRIVNVSSRAALVIAGGALAYTTAKAAVSAMTAALAAEVLPDDILVNAVAPSTIDTPANRAAMGDDAAAVARWPKPAEIAAAIVFLMSPENHVTSGAVVPVFGRA